MKRIGNLAALVVIALGIAALAFVWRQQINIVSMPQLRAQVLTLRIAALALLGILGVVTLRGPRWCALPFALVLHYAFLLPLFAFSGKSPVFWAIPYMKFLPQTLGQHITGTMELAHIILWHRFGLAGIVAVLAATSLVLLNDVIHERNEVRQQGHSGDAQGRG